MLSERVTVQNYENWGKLVMTWATGVNRFSSDYNGGVPPLPQSLGDLKDQCVWAQVGLSVPDHIKGIQFVQANQETLLIRLPPKAMIEEAEAAIRRDPKGYYALPQFYKDRYNGTEPTISDVDDALKFQASRIGDYTISQCG